jgi:hypothetical protein
MAKVEETWRHPRVFISYASRDSEFAEKLARDLRVRGIRAWLAAEEIKVGDSLTKTVKDGLTGSQWLIAIISPNSASSEWFEREIRMGISEEISRGRTFVLPALIAETPVPAALREKAFADFRLGYERGLRQILSSLRRGSGHNP